MARTKTTPVKSAQKNRKETKSIKEKRKSASRGTEQPGPASRKALRFSTRNGRRRTSSRRASNGKGKALPSNANLPPELRQAGLIAHQPMAKGKCFGPFKGQIINKKRPPSNEYSLLCKVGSKSIVSWYFYVHEEEHNKCKWLQQMQSAPSVEQQNIVAYNSGEGICYEATKDIAVGEELLVLFDAAYKGKTSPAYVENIPVQFLPQSEEGQLQVLPLEYKSRHNRTESADNTVRADQPHNEPDGDVEDSRDDSPGSDESDGSENSDEDSSEHSDGGDDEDAVNSDVEEDVSESEKDVEDEEDITTSDDANDEDYIDKSCFQNRKRNKKSRNVTKEKPVKRRKKVPLKVLDIKITNKENSTELTKYQCSYCAIESDTREVLDRHVDSKECLSLVFTCTTGCGRVFRSLQKQMKHLCTGKPKCSVCDEEFVDWNILMRHIRKQKMNSNHKLRCKVCDIEFEDKKEKRRHNRSKHQPPKQNLTCPVCEKVYSNKSYLREHLRTHNEDGFKCPECGKKFSSSSNLRKHVRKHNPDYVPQRDKRSADRARKKTCTECEKVFDSQHSLQIHMRTHTGEKPYQCDQCEWKFSQKSHLARHIRTVHRKEEDTGEGTLPPAEQPKKCVVCEKVYANSRVLKVHVMSVHEKERPHSCNYCDATFTQKGHLWRHKHAVHPDCDEVQKKLESGEYTCSAEGCSMRFSCGADLTLHMTAKHLTTWPYVCQECNVTFVSRGNLNKHIRRRHRDPETDDSNTCGTCYQSFSTAYQLSQHKRIHTGVKAIECHLCGHVFVQRSGLNKHLRCRRCPNMEGAPLRVSNKKIECDDCGRMFPGPSDLKTHMRTHTGEKPYECVQCNKVFSQRGNLTKHIKYIHEKMQRPKEKPRDKKYFCSLCGKAFLCPSSLSMHCRTHSGVKPFSCEECSASFAQAGNLKKHVHRWHNPDNPIKRISPRRKTKLKKRKRLVSDEEQQHIRKESSSDDTADQDNESDRSEDEVSRAAEGIGGSDRTVQEALPVAHAPVPVTSALEAYVNTRACTPLNTATQGQHNTPLNTATSSLSPSQSRASIIMSHFLNTAPVSVAQVSATSQSPQAASLVQVPSQPPVLVPTPYSAMTSAQIRAPVTQVLESSRDISSAGNVVNIPNGSVVNSSVVLPHMHTILAQQMSPAPFVPPAVLMSHGTQPDMTIFPFSPSNLFQQ